MFHDLTQPDTRLEECEEIYQQAKAGFAVWRCLAFQERIGYLRTLRRLIVTNLDQLVGVICGDTGKVPVEAVTADLLTVVDFLKYVEKSGEKALKPRRVPTPLLLFGKKSYVEYRPRGVVLVISPWNYPFQLALIPMISALFAGNAVILKPSEVTPKVGRAIAKLCHLSGFPPGVVQVALGDGRLGAELVQQHPDYIFFTGSVRTGKLIQEEAAKRLIPTTLELGGKDPMIVCADANLKRAAKAAVWGGLTNSGQVCMAVERIYVEQTVYEQFTDLVVREVGKLKQGQDQDSDLGVMTSRQQVEIVRAQVEDALEQGAVLLVGQHPAEWDLSEGLFIPPMVLVNVTQKMRIMREETFGPVLPIIPCEDVEQAVQLANDSNFGLNASVWSRDLGKARAVARELVAGNTAINDVIVNVANPHLPFGGVKDSGLGRYHGAVGFQTFCHQVSVIVDKGRRTKEINWYPYQGKYRLFTRLIRLLYQTKS